MRDLFAPGGIDRSIGALATRQFGLVTRAQLLAMGVDKGVVDRRLGSGRLVRLYAGVYAVGHRALGREARWLAAVLALGEGAVLSHRSAATLWRIRDGEGPRPEVTAATRSGRRRPGIALHRCRLDADDLTRRLGIPVTTPERTLLDIAGEIEPAELVRALREAQFLRLFDLEEMRAAIARRPCRAMRVLIEDLVVTQSGLEDRLLEICDGNGIERPLTQQPLLGRRVDFLWPREKVVVEADGWQAHGTRDAFQADRAIANTLQLRGYRILRFTSADLARRPTRTARQIRAALAD